MSNTTNVVDCEPCPSIESQGVEWLIRLYGDKQKVGRGDALARHPILCRRPLTSSR